MTAQADRGLSWVVVFSALLTNFLAYGFSYGMGIFYDEFLDVFGESKATTAWISSLNYGLMCGSGPITSILIEKLGCRITMMIGALLSFASLVISSFATSVYFLLVTLGIFTGAGFGMSYMSATVAVSYFFSKYRAIAMGIAVSGSAIGTFVFPLLNQYLVSIYGWRGAILINGAIHLHVIVAALLIPAVSPLQCDNATDIDKESSKNRWRSDCTSFLHNTGFILFCVNNFVFSLGLFVVYTHMASYARSLGLSKTFGGLLLSVTGIASLLGRLSLTAVAQLRILSVPTLYTLAFISAGSATSVSGFWNTKEGMITTSAIFGFFSSAFGCLTPETTCYIVGIKNFNKAFGIAMLMASLGIILGPPIAGSIYDATGFYPASFYFGGTCMILSAFVLAPVWMKCKKKNLTVAENEIKISINEENS